MNRKIYLTIIFILFFAYSIFPYGGSIPAGLPTNFGFGAIDKWDNQGGDTPTRWKDGQNSGCNVWDYNYQYLTSGWETWQSPTGQWATSELTAWQTEGQETLFTYYYNNGSTSMLTNTSTMTTWFNNLITLFKLINTNTSSGKVTIVHIEPDLLGFCETGGMTSSSTVEVAATGISDLSGIPNTLAGWWQAIITLRNKYASGKALVAIHYSHWADDDVFNSTSISSVSQLNTDVDAVSTFLKNVMGSYPADLIAAESSDRDADWYAYASNDTTRWANMDFTDPPTLPGQKTWGRIAYIVDRVSYNLGLRVIMWQIPVGNTYFKTCDNDETSFSCSAGTGYGGHFRDNAAQAFIPSTSNNGSSGSPGDAYSASSTTTGPGYWAAHGVIAVFFGEGSYNWLPGGSAHSNVSPTHLRDWGPTDNTTNPTSSTFNTTGNVTADVWGQATSSYADNDGGYIRLAVTKYCSTGKYSLTGSQSTPTYTPTSGPSPTRTPTFTITPTATNTPFICSKMIYTGDAAGLNLAAGTVTNNSPATMTEATGGNPGNCMNLNYVLPAATPYWQPLLWTLSTPVPISDNTDLRLDVKTTSGTAPKFIIVIDWGSTAYQIDVNSYISGGINGTWQTADIPLSVLKASTTTSITFIDFIDGNNTAYTVLVDNIRLTGGACPSATPTITDTFTISPTATYSMTTRPSSTYTWTPTFTLTSTRTSTSTQMPSATSSMTPTATATITATRTNTPTLTSTASNTSVNTATVTPTDTSTETKTNTQTDTITLTLTNTPVNTATLTATGTNTLTRTNTVTYTVTLTPTSTLQNTATLTATETNTPANTVTLTATRTNTAVNTATLTATGTNTPVNTATLTSTRTDTLTYTVTVTLTSTLQNTATLTATGTNTPVNTTTLTSTRTNTLTYTVTVTLTNTSINTATLTATGTNTPVNTDTSTATRTNTATNTPTNTQTASYTITMTYTTIIVSATITPTYTISPSFTITKTTTSTVTLTNTPTHTVTLTLTSTQQNTATLTATETNTVAPTFTNTGTPTFTVTRTNTGTNTATNTPTNTQTPTYTITMTFTTIIVSATITPTYTITKTITPTVTLTNTPTHTVTLTLTSTQQNTATLTATGTNTVAPTFTNTGTPTFTVTRTNTGTNTATNTQTPTYTITMTFTTIIVSATITPTYTISRTSTLTFTATYTVTPTYTVTMTMTCACFTGTFTPTNTATSTYTYTDTFTKTHTQTATLTATPTATSTFTLTDTFTDTYTPTLADTHTPTNTVTNTSTDTPVDTTTDTPIVSETPTYTATIYSPTISPTSTVSPTITLTNTPVNTLTDTPVNTATDTPVNTLTDTSVNTLTGTPVHTMTNTPVDTTTNTPTATPTIAINLVANITVSPASTGTGQYITVIMLVVNTGANIANNVAPSVLAQSGSGSATLVSGPSPANVPIGGSSQASFTWVYITSSTGNIIFDGTASGTDAVDGVSMTSVLVSSNPFICATATMTATETVTVTVTATSTLAIPSTATATTGFTRTTTQAPTATVTQTPVATVEPTGVITIGPIKPYPNPINPAKWPLKIEVQITPNDIESITLRIYTTAYRLIKEQIFNGTEVDKVSNGIILTCDSKTLSDLSDGAYYYVVIAQKGGVKVRSKVDKIIILK